ncbi:hypothetical protein [Actinomadura rugatobispora]|uniref:Uncharacterized protein n=1 Tax=Actinomadura rugatobispora TaxID=1994 RepID=A0ABW1AGN3_9ACTN|nr:hypothetical protein GCM10010200_025440 [Actinomadura rugatobispora]
MPRRRPGALRAPRRPRPITWAGDLERVDRLSIDASAAVHLAERLSPDADVRPGKTAHRLHIYRSFLRQPGNRLRLVTSLMPSCPGCQDDDVAVARDGLEAVLETLPPWARRELSRLLADLDAEFARRTLPTFDPSRRLDWEGNPTPWWHHRAYTDD